MKVLIRKSTSSDLDFLEELEKSCFPKFQQSTRRVIRYSLASPFQLVIIADISVNKITKPVASATLFPYSKTLRLFSIAVLPTFQGKGIGKQLIEYILQFARNNKFERISLEVIKSNEQLIRYYENLGFKITEELPEYYSKTEDGLRMVLMLDPDSEKQSISNIIIVRNPKNWNLNIKGTTNFC